MSHISASALSRAFELLSKIIDPASKEYILKTVLMRASLGKLELIGTNLESFLTVSIDIDNEVEFCVAVPHNLVKAYLAKETRPLQVFAQNNDLCFKSNSSLYRFNTLDSQEFPAVPTLEGYLGAIAINAKELSRHLALAVKTASKSSLDTSINSHCLRLVAQSGSLRIESVNNHVANQTQIESKTAVCDGSWILPTGVAGYVSKLGNTEISLQFYSDAVAIVSDGLRSIYRVQGDKFYDYGNLSGEDYPLLKCKASELYRHLSKPEIVTLSADHLSQQVIIEGLYDRQALNAEAYCSQAIQLNATLLKPILQYAKDDDIELVINPKKLHVLVKTRSSVSYIGLFNDTKEDNIPNKISCELVDISKYTPLKCDYELNNSEASYPKEPIMSNFNYFAELAQARQSGIWTETRNPRKDELIEAIAQHVEAKALEQETTIIPNAVSYESLFKAWSNKKEEKAAETKAPRVSRPSAKSQSWDEVWSADQIGYVKSDSFNGKVLECMYEGGIKLCEYDLIGLPSKRQVSQAIACISEKGYGVKKENDVYYLVLPEGMAAPCLK